MFHHHDAAPGTKHLRTAFKGKKAAKAPSAGLTNPSRMAGTSGYSQGVWEAENISHQKGHLQAQRLRGGGTQ